MALYAIIYFLVLFVSKVSKGQSTSTPCSTCSAAPTCTGCNINADVLTMSNTSWSYADPATGTPYLMANLHFTAYSVTTASSVSGKCHTYTNSPTPVIQAYIVSMPREFYDFIPISIGNLYTDAVGQSSAELRGYTSFLDDAYSSFYSREGYEGCTASIPPSQLIPTFLGSEAVVAATAASSITPAGSSSLAASTATLTTSSAAGHHARRTRTIILSVIIPTVGVMTLLLSFVIIRRYRKKRSPAALTVDPKTTSDTQLYLDRKAELEDEERRRHELDAGGKVHEMDGQDTLFEMPGDDKSRMNLASPHKMQELRGLDHSQELEVPSNV